MVVSQSSRQFLMKYTDEEMSKDMHYLTSKWLDPIDFMSIEYTEQLQFAFASSILQFGRHMSECKFLIFLKFVWM